MPPPSQPRRRPRAIFLDAAGTLFQVDQPVGQAYARVGAQHGVAADPGQLDAAFKAAWRGLPPPLHPEDRPPPDDDRSWWREVVRQTFSRATGHAMPPESFESLFDDLYSHYGSSSAWRLHDEAKDAVRELSRHSRLLVVSNFDRRLRGILEGLGIAGYFERLIISSEVGASKPHPRMFRAALAACGLPAEECLHVGDDQRADAAGARAAGIESFHISRPGVTLKTLVEKLASDDFPACICGIPD